MLELGIIRPSKSSWALSFYLVPNSGNWCACGDFRALNVVTKPDHYPITDMTAIVLGEKIYHQIPVETEHILKTVLKLLSGCLSSCMSHCLRNAAQSFQRFIDHVLHDLHFTCAFYWWCIYIQFLYGGKYKAITACVWAIWSIWSCYQPCEVWIWKIGSDFLMSPHQLCWNFPFLI